MTCCETFAIDDPRWTAVLGRLRHDFYHVPSYVKLDAERIKATPEAMLISDNERLFFIPYLVRACSPLSSESQEPVFDVVSPYGYPGILLSDAGRDASFAAEGLAAFRSTLSARNVCSAFLRMHPILGSDFTTLFAPEVFSAAYETVAVDLQQSDADLLKQVREGHRRTYKKCLGLGYTARIVSLADVIEPFVDLYEQTMNRVHATDIYYFDNEYFLGLAHSPGVHCCVIESQSTIAAACIFFECDGIVTAHLGGTRTEFLSKSPFVMAMIEAIFWAKSRGNRWLNLGGGVGGRFDPLFHFKSGFADTRFQFLTSSLIIDESKYQQLVHLKALEKQLAPESLLSSGFFPAYRS
jgi:hypothetical protein